MRQNKHISTTLSDFLNEQNENLNENFYEWFGESIVVDDNNKPLICYHGTDSEFNEFKISKYGSNGSGIYFTPYKEIAKMSGKRLIEAYIKIENKQDGVVLGYEVIVKKTQNIKSVDNDGSWDIDDANIYS